MNWKLHSHLLNSKTSLRVFSGFHACLYKKDALENKKTIFQLKGTYLGYIGDCTFSNILIA